MQLEKSLSHELPSEAYLFASLFQAPRLEATSNTDRADCENFGELVSPILKAIRGR